MRWFVLFVCGAVAVSCSPQDGASSDATARNELAELPTAEIRQRAGAGDPAAQRTLAGRLLFSGKTPTSGEIASALEWTEKAARGGDATASVWMGRKFLNPPENRITAGAWFLVATQSGDAAAAYDAGAELDALSLNAGELAAARTLASEIRKSIMLRSK